VRRVTGVEQLQAGAVEVHPVQVREVRVLALLVAVRDEVHDARLLVHVLDVAVHELARRDLVLQLAVRVEQVVVAPAVALGPVNQLLAVVDQEEGPRLHVRVQPLLDERLHLAGGRVGHAHVDAVQVAARPPEVQLAGGRGHPARLGLLLLAVAVEHRRRRDVERLVHEPVGLHLHVLLRAAVEHDELGLVHVLLARHRVAVGLELRPRLGQRIDHPQVGHLALVHALDGELGRVLRPVGPDGWHARPGRVLVVALLVLLQVLLLLRPDPPREAVVLFPVGRELRLLDGRVAEVLLRLRVAGRVHHVEVLSAREQDRLTVGRDLRPLGLVGLGLEALEQRHLAGREAVLEVELAGLLLGLLLGALGLPALLLLLHLPGLLLLLLFLLLFGRGRLSCLDDLGVLRDLDVEADAGVLVHPLELLHGQVLRVVRDARDLREHRRHLRVVEERRARPLHRVHEHPARALGRLEAVPETVAQLGPVRLDGRVEHELLDLLGHPAGRQLVVRLDGLALLRDDRDGNEGDQDGERPEGSERTDL
jgi:hypothetical protein